MGSTMSVRAFAKMGSSFSLFHSSSGNPLGKLHLGVDGVPAGDKGKANMSVLSFVNFGSSMSIRSMVRIFGQGNPGSFPETSGFSIMRMTCLGSAVSLRHMARLGSRLSVGGLVRGVGEQTNGSNFMSTSAHGGRHCSVVHQVAIGSTISTRSFVRLGGSMSTLNFLHLGSACSLRAMSRMGSGLSIAPRAGTHKLPYQAIFGSASDQGQAHAAWKRGGVSIADSLCIGSALSLRNFAKTAGNANPGAYAFSTFDFMHMGSGLSMRSFMRLGSNLSVFPMEPGTPANEKAKDNTNFMVLGGSESGSTTNTPFSVFNAIHFGSSMSVRRAARFGGSTNNPGLSVMRMAQLGSTMSIRSWAVLGGGFLGGKLSVLQTQNIGSALSIRSFVRLGSSLSMGYREGGATEAPGPTDDPQAHTVLFGGTHGGGTSDYFKLSSFDEDYEFNPPIPFTRDDGMKKTLVITTSQLELTNQALVGFDAASDTALSANPNYGIFSQNGGGPVPAGGPSSISTDAETDTSSPSFTRTGQDTQVTPGDGARDALGGYFAGDWLSGNIVAKSDRRLKTGVRSLLQEFSRLEREGAGLRAAASGTSGAQRLMYKDRAYGRFVSAVTSARSPLLLKNALKSRNLRHGQRAADERMVRLPASRTVEEGVTETGTAIYETDIEPCLSADCPPPKPVASKATAGDLYNADSSSTHGAANLVLDMVRSLRPVSFVYKHKNNFGGRTREAQGDQIVADPATRQQSLADARQKSVESKVAEAKHSFYGFIAQDLERNFPTMVSTGQDGLKNIRINDMIAVLTMGLQVLDTVKMEAAEQQLSRLARKVAKDHSASVEEGGLEPKVSELEDKLIDHIVEKVLGTGGASGSSVDARIDSTGASTSKVNSKGNSTSTVGTDSELAITQQAMEIAYRNLTNLDAATDKRDYERLMALAGLGGLNFTSMGFGEATTKVGAEAEAEATTKVEDSKNATNTLTTQMDDENKQSSTTMTKLESEREAVQDRLLDIARLLMPEDEKDVTEKEKSMSAFDAARAERARRVEEVDALFEELGLDLNFEQLFVDSDSEKDREQLRLFVEVLRDSSELGEGEREDTGTTGAANADAGAESPLKMVLDQLLELVGSAEDDDARAE
jgi:hypothetical protein